MRIDAEHQSLIISEDELAAVAAELKLPRNKLALINAQLGTRSAARAMKDFDDLPGWAKEVYKQSFVNMASPAQTARVNIAYPSQAISRLALAWDRNNSSNVTVIARMGDEVALKQMTALQAEGLIGKPLAADSVKSTAAVKLKFPAVTLVAFLAAIDYAQYDWYVSSLKHAEPAGSFTLDEIWARLQDAAGGDYRWPLPLFFSVFPVDISGVLNEKDLASSLDHLVRAGLLTGDESAGAGDGVYTLSTEGRAIAGSFINSGARVAMSVSAPVSGGTGHEALLFVRDSDSLWLFDLSGSKGAVAGLGPGAFHEIIKIFFTLEREQESKGPACPYCGKKIGAVDEFCPECGKPVKAK
jgi:hypothetical protein